jgi:hypothetical protein
MPRARRSRRCCSPMMAKLLSEKSKVVGSFFKEIRLFFFRYSVSQTGRHRTRSRARPQEPSRTMQIQCTSSCIDTPRAYHTYAYVCVPVRASSVILPKRLAYQVTRLHRQAHAAAATTWPSVRVHAAIAQGATSFLLSCTELLVPCAGLAIARQAPGITTSYLRCAIQKQPA